MHAHASVLKNTAARDEHHGWLYRQFRRRSREGLDPHDPATWTSFGGTRDPGRDWVGEQRFIEQQQRAVGHM